MSVENNPLSYSRLAELDVKWRAVLASTKQGPPLLGLAPFSEDEEKEVTRLVLDAFAVSYGTPLDGMLRLLKRRPSMMLVWLARKAGAAYDDGKFWENLEREIGVGVPVPRRSELVITFSGHARVLMANFTPPPNLGAFHLMETLLFHAGLPLCHCGSFAKACRWVEQHSGLPDPESAEAGEELCNAVLECPYIQSIPILLKSLRGPAGPLVCAQALNLIFELDTPPANPRLTAALREAFESDSTRGPRRSARPPYLQLAADLCSLEIVGPRQDTALLVGNGTTWVINGIPHRRGPEEEFSVVLSDESRVEIELRGLVGGMSCRTVFEFDWAKRPKPFFVFDAASRREKRVNTETTVTLRSGEYWLMHPTKMTVNDSNSRYDWPNRRNTISQLTLRPGHEVCLEGERATTFRAAQSPFIEANGQIVRTDDDQRVHFGWTDLPEVWCPAEDERPTNWQLAVTLDKDKTPRVFTLDGGEKVGDFLRFTVGESDWLKHLPSGLHHFQCMVTRGGRRTECEQEFWYWAGLNDWTDGEGFACTSMPLNLHLPTCRGFEQADGLLCHQKDARRMHSLAFEVAGNIHSFCWSQSGLFLESFERRAGISAQPEAHRLESSFSADAKSPLWLRVWQIPSHQAEIYANGRSIQRFAPNRTSVDISLAHLATLFPDGGNLARVACGLEMRIASFHRPLAVTSIKPDSSDGYESLSLQFGDEVRWVRPRVRELLSGREFRFDGKRFGTSGHCLFHTDGLPTVECSNIGRDSGLRCLFCRISIDVPKIGWPAGIWFAELEIRRDDTQSWQPARDELGGHAPLVLRQSSNEG